ncbi:MAG: glutaredoxin [Candidatus Aminicenantes bacterium]|nr:glutaredoxin [Candidatus Aminicenantes bacterium]
MALLNDEVREATRKKFADEMVNPVRIIHFTQEPGRLIVLNPLAGQECFFCKETKQLLEEVAACSDKIRLEVYDFKADKLMADELGIDKIPATVIQGEKPSAVRIFGIPSGYEYTSLVEALIDVSTGETSLDPKTKEALKTIDRDVHIQVFVTPTCPYCSLAVRLAHQFALESPRIKADMIESTEFPHLANKFGVYGVPKTVVNETTSFEGAVPEDVFLANVLKAPAPPPQA